MFLNQIQPCNPLDAYQGATIQLETIIMAFWDSYVSSYTYMNADNTISQI